MFPLSQNNLYTQMQISTSHKKDQYSIKYPMQNNLKTHQFTDDLDTNYKRIRYFTFSIVLDEKVLSKKM